MEYNIREDERKQFFRYFRIWIIVAAVMLVLWGILAIITNQTKDSDVRDNSLAPSQRVYDYADVLTDAQEESLARVIAECEEQGKCDIILVTVREEMGLSDSTWEKNMMKYADDFYDKKAFGYNKPHGSGALILDNWYEDENGSQKGTWLSTSGKMEDIIGTGEENTILDALYAYISSDPARGYEAAVRKIAYWGDTETRQKTEDRLSPGMILIFSFIVAFIYAVTHMVQKPGKDTTTASTYVAGGHPRMRAQRDDFVRKSVTSVKIQTDSGSGSSGRSRSGGGSAGHHTSSGGYSHGGGGRRR